MRTREQKIYKVTLVGSVVNALLVVLKFVAGILGNSAAMVADAVHSLSDFITDIVVLVMVRLSSRPADSDHDYGHGKYETVATSIIGMALAAAGVILAWNGGGKILKAVNGGTIDSPGMIAFIAAVVSIVAKEWIFRITHRTAKETDSSALEANAWHHRSDALSSIGTAAGIGGAVFIGSRWAVLDPIAAIVVSIFIIVTALRMLRQAAGELLEESLPKETEDRIEEIVYRDAMISDVHNMHTRRIGSRIAIEMHLRLPGNMTLEESHAHASAIEEALREEFGADTHIMLHIEPVKNQ